MSQDVSLAERTLGELLPYALTSSICIHIDKGKKVLDVAGMLVQYLESVTDSVVVKDGKELVGIVGGKEIIQHLLKNSTPKSFYERRVEEIMDPHLITVSESTKYKDLLNHWKKNERAYAVISNGEGFYSAISARTILEIGMRCRTDISVNNLPKKQNVTFKKNDTFRSMINSMVYNKTRNILLENSNKYINDRLIIENVTQKMSYLRGEEDFLDNIVNVELEEAKVISENLKINEVSAMMYDMEHPYVMYEDQIVTPWDICNALSSPEITEYL
jgi:predicted transcriptional regulator